MALPDMLTSAPSEAVDIIARLLQFNPDKRITAKECLQHNYVSRYVSFFSDADELYYHIFSFFFFFFLNMCLLWSDSVTERWN